MKVRQANPNTCASLDTRPRRSTSAAVAQQREAAVLDTLPSITRTTCETLCLRFAERGETHLQSDLLVCIGFCIHGCLAAVGLVAIWQGTTGTAWIQ